MKFRLGRLGRGTAPALNEVRKSSRCIENLLEEFKVSLMQNSSFALAFKLVCLVFISKLQIIDED